jgi:hypothetical protein
MAFRNKTVSQRCIHLGLLVLGSSYCATLPTHTSVYDSHASIHNLGSDNLSSVAYTGCAGLSLSAKKKGGKKQKPGSYHPKHKKNQNIEEMKQEEKGQESEASLEMVSQMMPEMISVNDINEPEETLIITNNGVSEKVEMKVEMMSEKETSSALADKKVKEQPKIRQEEIGSLKKLGEGVEGLTNRFQNLNLNQAQPALLHLLMRPESNEALMLATFLLPFLSTKDFLRMAVTQKPIHDLIFGEAPQYQKLINPLENVRKHLEKNGVPSKWIPPIECPNAAGTPRIPLQNVVS